MIDREDFDKAAKMLRRGDALDEMSRSVVIAALDLALTCCRSTPLPAPWTAGVDDSADRPMVMNITAIAGNLNYETPLWEFILMLEAAVGIDSRTRLGGDIQRCLLTNAAARLRLLGEKIEPHPWTNTLRWRIRDAWAVLCRRSIAISLGPKQND